MKNNLSQKEPRPESFAECIARLYPDHVDCECARAALGVSVSLISELFELSSLAKKYGDDEQSEAFHDASISLQWHVAFFLKQICDEDPDELDWAFAEPPVK